MSEMKRVEFTTVQPSQKEKKAKKKLNTYRIVLTLGESNQTTCPEYSFTDLIKTEKIEEDNDVAAIAKYLEEKYGLGDGYDEDDPFIDNTEAYDEVIPSSKKTKYGGFYINQGKLDLQSVDDDSVDEFASSPGIRRKKKKRVLDSESEEETGEALKEKFKAMKRQKLLKSKENEKKRKKKMTNGEEKEGMIKKKKKKKMDQLMQPTIKKVMASSDPLSQRENSLSSLGVQPAVNTPSSDPALLPHAKIHAKIEVITNGITEEDGEVKAKDVKDLKDEPANVFAPPEIVREDSSSKSEEESKGEQQSVDKNTQLPAQLPQELLDAIENIKKEAKENKEGKNKFFSADINKLLLDIELGSRNLAWGARTAIYNHLGEHLPCGKHTLLRRAKKLRESQQEDQFKVPIQKLREAIQKIMPGLEEQHELEVQKVKMEAELKDDVADAAKEEASTESEGEEKVDNRKKPRGPRRKFQWNAEIKHLLLDVVSTKMRLYNTCKSRNQTPEEYLRAFLDSDIKPLWPQGWMQTRMLFKESRSAHEDMTKVGQIKQKKVTSGLETTQLMTESCRPHVSKTEDVIEVSSVMEDDSDLKDTVVVNLSNSDIRSIPNLLPVTAASHLSVTSMANTSTSPVGGSKQSLKQTTTPTSLSMLTSPVTSALPQKLNDTSSSSAIKRVTPIPVPEISDSSLSRNTATSKTFSSGSTASSTPVGHGPNLTSQSQSRSSNNRSFSDAYGSFISQTSVKHDSSMSPSQLQQQSSPQQQKMFSPQQQKVSVLPPKLVSQQPVTSIYQQTKLPQDQHRPVTSQKAAGKSVSLVVTTSDVSSPSWPNLSSVVPSGKSTSPIVSVTRIPVTSSHRLPDGGKISPSSLQHNQMLMQQTKGSNTVDLKGYQNFPKKKQSPGNVNNPVSLGAASTQFPQANKLGGSVNTQLSSKQDHQNKVLYSHQQVSQKTANPANQQLKSGIILGTSNPMHPHHQHHLKTGTVLGTSPVSSPKSTVRTADFSSWNSSITHKNSRQPSPPRKLVPSSITVDGSSPTASSSKTSGLLNSSFTSSPSRGSTPSPQKSPLSPAGNPALTLYEQIQSHIRNQEAMEGQALKNLALALQFDGTGASASFLGLKPATEGEEDKSCQPRYSSNDISGKDSRMVKIEQTLPTSLSQDLPRLKGEKWQSVHPKLIKKDLVKASSHNHAVGQPNTEQWVVESKLDATFVGHNHSKSLEKPVRLNSFSQNLPISEKGKLLMEKGLVVSLEKVGLSKTLSSGKKSICNMPSSSSGQEKPTVQSSVIVDKKKDYMGTSGHFRSSQTKPVPSTVATSSNADTRATYSKKDSLLFSGKGPLVSSSAVSLSSSGFQNIFDKIEHCISGVRTSSHHTVAGHSSQPPGKTLPHQPGKVSCSRQSNRQPSDVCSVVSSSTGSNKPTSSHSAHMLQDSFSRYSSQSLENFLPQSQKVQKSLRQQQMSQAKEEAATVEKNRLEEVNSYPSGGQGSDASNQSGNL